MSDHTLLLGGAERKHTRVRGFAEWSPHRKTRALLVHVNAVLHEYADHLPLTIRQIFYRLVGAHGYEKTEQSYDRLIEYLNRARRARMIPMDAIRDDGGAIHKPVSYRSAGEFLATVRWRAERFRLDRTAGQECRLAVICEAAGMVPQLSRVTDPYGVTVMSSGGFDSTTDRHAFAAELAEHDRPTEVLHIGDHDPSGTHMFLAFLEDVEAFARELGGAVAVTPEQIDRLRLPTAPPKATDNRAFYGATCQAEAIAPDDLATILREAIEARIDQRALSRVRRQEAKARRELIEWLGG